MKRWVAFSGLVATALVWAGFFHTKSLQIEAEPITAWSEDHKGDCAVVLTGGPGRVREGLDLLSQGQVHKLIISGVHPHANLREIYPQWPFYGSLRETDVVLERRSTTTYGNAQQSLPLVEAMHCRSVVLITSHIHMPRALATFRQIFPPEILILPRSVSSGSIPPRQTDVMVETLKSMFYSLWAY